jgi:hypothetical protein
LKLSNNNSPSEPSDPNQVPVHAGPPAWFMRLPHHAQALIAFLFALYFSLWAAFCPVAMRFPRLWLGAVVLAVFSWLGVVLWLVLAALHRRNIQVPGFLGSSIPPGRLGPRSTGLVRYAYGFAHSRSSPTGTGYAGPSHPWCFRLPGGTPTIALA